MSGSMQSGFLSNAKCPREQLPWQKLYGEQPVVPLAAHESWRSMSAWAHIDSRTFYDYRWQERNSVSSYKQLAKLLGGQVSASFLEDAAAGISGGKMALRVSPYILSLIDWTEPFDDPLRRQFIPLASEREKDHPRAKIDSLSEREDEGVPGLVHRYPDKALLLALDACPVYCRFCTRSYVVGGDTDALTKDRMPAKRSRWGEALQYIESTPTIEDVVVSGGDLFRLKPESIEFIGRSLLDIPSIRRIRFATKGLAVQPMKVLTHPEWVRAVARVVEIGRRNYKQVCIHTHFNHPREITDITEASMRVLFELGVVVRNQTVLLRGVNDNSDTMSLLVKRLGYVNIQPYYVYVCDMVRGCEDMRTSLRTAERIEKEIRGITAGFNTPTFVVDTPGGGGKREIRSYELYDRERGIALYSSPGVKPGQSFLFFDPLRDLPARRQAAWACTDTATALIREAQAKASPGL